MAIDIIGYGEFIATKVGKTGLTDVTVDVDKIERSTGTRTAVATGAATTEGRNGWYYYRVASATPETHDYIWTFKTSDSTVDAKQTSAVWTAYAGTYSTQFGYLDAAVSTRSTYAGADTSGTTTLLGRILGTLAAGTHNAQSGDAYARIGAAGAGLTAIGDTRIANLDTTVSSRSTYAGTDTAGTTELLTRIPDATPNTSGGLPVLDSNLNIQSDISRWKGSVAPANTGDSYAFLTAMFNGMTSLPKWLRTMIRKSTADSTAKSEINDSGGTFDETTDSLEATGTVLEDLVEAISGTDDDTLKTLSDQIDSIPEATWSHDHRSLTSLPSEVISEQIDGDTIIRKAGDYWSISMEVGDITSNTKCWFTIKSSKSSVDSAAIVQIEKTAGLLYINGTAGTALNGTLTVNNATTGSITITLKASETAKITPKTNYFWDVQVLISSNAITKAEGIINVTGHVTHATS